MKAGATVERNGRRIKETVIDCGQVKRLLKEKMRRGDERESRVIFRVDASSCAVPPRSDTAVGAHFGRAGQGLEMDTQKVR